MKFNFILHSKFGMKSYDPYYSALSHKYTEGVATSYGLLDPTSPLQSVNTWPLESVPVMWNTFIVDKGCDLVAMQWTIENRQKIYHMFYHPHYIKNIMPL